MRQFYSRYKDELLTGISILAPIFLAYISSLLTGSRFIDHVRTYWQQYALISLLFGVTSYVLVLRGELQVLRRTLVSPFESKDDRRYRNVVDRAKSQYYLLGMSAEEFQRHVPLRDYFIERARSGRPIKELRFLLLHPDSHFFGDRLLEVNPGCNVKSLIERKKEIIRSLFHGLNSLPPRTIEQFEIRFFDFYPIWMMQFFDDENQTATRGEGLNSLVISFHLRGDHSKRSPHFLLSGQENPLFDSFLNYFERLWDSSLPTQNNGDFPKIYSAENKRIRLLMFDLDGVVVESSEAKKSAFLSVYEGLTPTEHRILLEAYEKNEGLTRQELFHLGNSVIGRRPPTSEDLARMSRLYSTQYLSRLDNLKLVDGFEAFYRMFRSKYRLAIVSNAPIDEIQKILKAKGISDWFSQISGYPTPKVEAVRKVLSTLELSPTNALYVGDTKEDLIVSQATGMHFLARWRNPKRPPVTSQDKMFATYDELARKVYELEASEREGTADALA